MKVYSVYYVTKTCRRAIVTADSMEEAKQKFYNDDCDYDEDYYDDTGDSCEVVEVVEEEGDDEDE